MKKKITLLDGAVGTTLWEHTNDHDPVWKYNIEISGISVFGYDNHDFTLRLRINYDVF